MKQLENQKKIQNYVLKYKIMKFKKGNQRFNYIKMKSINQNKS